MDLWERRSGGADLAEGRDCDPTEKLPQLLHLDTVLGDSGSGLSLGDPFLVAIQ